MRNGRTRGFTLIEMIVAVVMAASLGLVIYTTFAQGVRVWKRAAKDRGEWSMELWKEKMTGNLRNAFRDSRWPLKGTNEELYFSTLMHEGGKQWTKDPPVYFHYRFDSKAKAIKEYRYAFEDVLVPKPGMKTVSSVLEKILAFNLEYYDYDPKTKEYRWKSEWKKDCFPETVKITIEPEQMNQRKWICLIPMPVESKCES